MRYLESCISVDDAIALYGRFNPVEPKVIPLAMAIGLRVVSDIPVRRDVPMSAQAAINGFALKAADVALATRRKPVLLKFPASPVDRGSPLPPGCDAVLPFELCQQAGDIARALGSVVEGFGIHQPGGLIKEGEILFRAGQIITMASAMAGASCGINEVTVRQPVVDIIFNARSITRNNDRMIDVVSSSIRGSGSKIGAISFTAGDPLELADLLVSSAADIITVVGGTGNGPSDTTVEAIASVGEVLFHGIRLSPGSSMALGMVGGKPVFASPASLPDIAAVNIVMTPAFSRRLFGRPQRPMPFSQSRLLQAIPASKGATQVFFANLNGEEIMPLGSDAISMMDIARANAVIIMPEGARHKRVGEFVPYLRLGSVM
ncbi:MAG: molybdopterin-binding protein [Beijerinckiaceae bacterium]